MGTLNKFQAHTPYGKHLTLSHYQNGVTQRSLVYKQSWLGRDDGPARLPSKIYNAIPTLV